MPTYPMQFSGDKVVTITYARDSDITGKLVDIITEKKEGGSIPPAFSIVETAITKNTLERHTFSDFGLIGWIITQFVSD